MGACSQNTLLARMSSKNDESNGNAAEQLVQLIQETCQHPAGSARRQRGMTKIIRTITPRLWHSSAAYYPDALQQTWIYFCRNLCEATTGRAYDPERANVVTWLNAYLKRRLQDFQIAENRQRATTISQASFKGGENGPLDPVDRLAAKPDIPPWLERVQAWAEADENKELTSVHIKGHPKITAQLLILKRLPPETPWKELSAEYRVSVGTLSSFYQRQCLDRLRKYGQAQGYL